MIFGFLQLISILSAKIRCCQSLFELIYTFWFQFRCAEIQNSISWSIVSCAAVWHDISYLAADRQLFCENPVRSIAFWADLHILISIPMCWDTKLDILINRFLRRCLTWYFVSRSWSPAFLRKSGAVHRFLSWFTHFDFNSDARTPPRSKTRYLDQSLLAPLFDMIFSYLAGYLTVITRSSLNVLEPTNNRKAQERAARTPYSKSGLPF